MTGGKTDRGLEEEKKRGVIVSRTVEWRRSDFGNRLASRPLVGWKIAKRRRNRQLISLAAADGLCGRFFFGVEEEESDDDVCVSERRKRRGFLLKQTSRLDGRAGMREKLRSGILVRAVGLFCSATATGPTGEQAKAWPASERGRGRRPCLPSFPKLNPL